MYSGVPGSAPVSELADEALHVPRSSLHKSKSEMIGCVSLFIRMFSS
jgi:hypothetical protein